MPGLDGRETTQRIRQGAAGQDNLDILIIAMTASAMDSDRHKCLEAGMDDYLTKPLDETLVVQTLGQWLSMNETGVVAPLPITMDPEDLTFNRETALRRLGHKHGLLEQACRSFLTLAPQQLQDLQTAYHNQAWDQLSRHLHTFKSISGQVGGDRLTAMVRRLEHSLQQDNSSFSSVDLALLQQHFDELYQAIQTWLASPTRSASALPQAPDPTPTKPSGSH